MIPKPWIWPVRLALAVGLLFSPAEVRADAPITAPSGATPAHQPIHYLAQSGDSLAAVAARFGVTPQEIRSPAPILEPGFIAPGQILILPPRLRELPAPAPLLPDSEIINGPSAMDFNPASFLRQAGGYLGEHREYLRSTGWTSAGDIIQRVAAENSVNPRLLIALLEQECGCVRGPLAQEIPPDYLLGIVDYRAKGLYGQMSWAANELSRGYYGWRNGSLTEFRLPDGSLYHPEPNSSAATVALQVYFANLIATRQQAAQSSWGNPLLSQDRQLSNTSWQQAVDVESGLPALHLALFGDPWKRAAQTEPIFPAGLQQPELHLPFETGFVWSYSSGPHKAWQTENDLAALDFAPATEEWGCVPTEAFVTAMAAGPVIYSGFGMVLQDLDSSGPNGQRIPADGLMGTGWVMLYMHIQAATRVPVGTYLQQGDPLGKPSCEGGPATGTHTHVARRYNGEWVAAGGALPFNFEGWTAHNGPKPYEGTLTCPGRSEVIARPNGTFVTQIYRPEPTPTVAPGPASTPTRSVSHAP